ncbi:MAG: T9SS type A sorting domain-containing protein [Calditrichia bacterium]
MNQARLKYLVSVLLVMTAIAYAQDLDKSKQKQAEPLNSHYTLWNINNQSGWIRNDGNSGSSPHSNSRGTTYPRQTARVVYQDGLIWAGVVRDNDPSKPALRAGGQNYRPGTTSGYISTPGPNPVPSGNSLRIFRVRRDYNELTTNSADIILDAAELFDVDTSQVTEQQAQSVLDQYALDWQEWPANLGAPFYDNNGNGTYESAVDEPGLADADQVLWFVAHDLDSLVTTSLYGSPPIGLEVQTTLWGYKGESGALGEMTFQRFRMVNKSGYPVDSMFVSRWVDVDLGNFAEDLVACDSVLGLGYVYNGFPEDEEYAAFGLAPAAFGYAVLQGPVIESPGDSATVNFNRIPGYRNLSMTSFGVLNMGSSTHDPGPFGDYEATEEWYTFMQGYLFPGFRWRVGSGPNRNQETSFPVHGDPVTNSGDIDGQGDNLAPSDRRLYLASGPFFMQPGDTQEVIYALVGGIGVNRFESITNLRKNRAVAEGLQKALFQNIPGSVKFTSETIYNSTQVNEVRFRAENQDASAMDLLLKSGNGFPITTLPLFDDGQHNDGVAGDGIWGNSWFTTPSPSAVSADLNVSYQQGFDFLWEDIDQSITTSGPVRISQALIGSDNTNQDGVANPGENIRFTLEVENQSAFNYSTVRINQVKVLQPSQISELTVVNNEPVIPSLPGNSTYFTPYNPSESYFSLTIDQGVQPGDSVQLVYQLTSFKNNTWTDTVSIVVAALPNEPLDFLMTKTNGNTEGALGYRIYDAAALTGHTYRVSFEDSLSVDVLRYQLEDITSGTVVLNDQPYPDEFAHTSPAIDGFLITRGTTLPEDDVSHWQWRGGERWLTGVNFGGRSFEGGVDLGSNVFGSSLQENDFKEVKIVFDSTLATNANVFRRDMGYSHAGLGTFPGEAYDIEDPANPRRLNIIFVEDATWGNADLMWNPDTFALGGREFLLIMDSDYNEVDGGGYTEDAIIFGGTPTQWVLWAETREGFTAFQSPASLSLFIYRGIEPGASYEFTPDYPTAIGDETNKPLTFELLQNYPNPFNPETTIKFQIPSAQKVTLQIFNVLGQRVTILVDNKLSAGSYQMRWDGRSQSGNSVSSGVYFYRIEAGDFIKTRKMLLVR